MPQDLDVFPAPETYRAAPTLSLEMELDQADAARLLRHPALQPLRAGPARTAAHQLVWHDTAAVALAAQGLTIAQTLGRRGLWRLERLHPGSPLQWPPAASPPILAEAADRALLNPSPLAPVAAFHGRLRTQQLLFPHGAGCLTLLTGRIRGIAADHPACRLRLTGPAEDCAELACLLAGPARLRVPAASLAAHAQALARQTPIPPPRLGAPTLPPGLSAGEAAAWVFAHLAETVLHWAREVPAARTPEPVHQMRVAVRRLRSALSVFRRMAEDEAGGSPALDALSLALRDLAGRLGTARDWDVFVTETASDVQRALPEEPRLQQMIAAAGRRRMAAYADMRAYLSGPDWPGLAMRIALLASRTAWRDAPAAAQPAEVILAQSLARRLKHVLAPGEDLSGLAAEQLHDIRKQAKRLRYATEIAAPLFGGRAVRRYLKRLQALQEALGAVNDQDAATALTRQLDTGRAFAAGLIQGFGAARAAHAAALVQRIWGKFYRADPFWD